MYEKLSDFFLYLLVMHLVTHLDLLVRFFNPSKALLAVFLRIPFFVDFFLFVPPPRNLRIFAPHALAALEPFFNNL